jgi:hypothetical protein
MTAVHPTLSGNLQSPANINIINEGLTIVRDGRYRGLKFPDEEFVDEDALLQSFSPLLRVMKVFGMYVEPVEKSRINVGGSRKMSLTIANDFEQRQTNVPAAADRLCQAKKSAIRCGLGEIYSLVILSILWINFFRFLTTFNGRDSFDELLTGKIVNLSWFLLCAINQTSFFIAHCSGRLHSILRETRVTKDLADGIRKKAVVNTIITVSIYSVNVVFFLYYFFISGDSYYDFSLAPAVTLFPVDNAIIKYILRSVFCLIDVYVLSSLILPQAFYNVLASLFSGQFLKLEERLKESIGVDGRFTGSMSTYRRRHQMICRDVKCADYFVSVSNLAALGLHGASQILIVYYKMFQAADTIEFGFVAVTWILINGMHFMIAVINGVAVNNAVSHFRHIMNIHSFHKSACYKQWGKYLRMS